MFDEFRPSSSRRQARRRLGGSMALAAVMYGALAVLIVGGSRAATRVIEEDLVQVKLATPPPPPPPAPEPPPPAEAPPPTAAAKPKAKRRELKPPDDIPQDKPKESDQALAPSEEAGPVDGFTDGVEGGTGTGSAPPPPPPPPPEPEPLIPPVALKTNTAPQVSASARRKQISGAVVVTFDVLENGTVANVQIVSGPEELHESVQRTVASWRFEPARRGGKPVRARQTKSIVFRLSDG